MGQINKTDKLDARGLNQLQRNGTLPPVGIPPGERRDQRDLPRTRMVVPSIYSILSLPFSRSKALGHGLLIRRTPSVDHLGSARSH
jgi:hypothetical protein